MTKRSLVLAMPTPGDEWVTAGSTTVLSKAVALTIAPLVELTGETFERRFVWGDANPVLVQQIRPLVVEVSADAAATSVCFDTARASCGLDPVLTRPTSSMADARVQSRHPVSAAAAQGRPSACRRT